MTFLLKVPPVSNTTARSPDFKTHRLLKADHPSHRIPPGPLPGDKIAIHFNSSDLQSLWQGNPAGGRESWNHAKETPHLFFNLCVAGSSSYLSACQGYKPSEIQLGWQRAAVAGAGLGFHSQHCVNRAGQACVPVSPAMGRWRQKYRKFKVILE